MYVNWLNMCRAGVTALEYYSPEQGRFRQAHMHARYVILQVLLEAGQGLVSVKQTTDEKKRPDARITLDRSKIVSVGKPAIGAFMRKLQVYKSTADVAGGRALFAKYDRVTPEFAKVREAVLVQKKPRQMYVQPHTSVGPDGAVTLRTFDATCAGMIASFQARFPASDAELMRLVDDEAACHKYNESANAAPRRKVVKE